MPAAIPLSELADEFYALSRPNGMMITPEQCQQCAIDALRVYCTWGALSAYMQPSDDTATPDSATTFDQLDALGRVSYPNKIEVGSNIPVSLGEWGLIKPLFVLYVERENAIILESTRVLGADVFGRAVSEIAQDIQRCEDEMPQKAFSQAILSV